MSKWDSMSLGGAHTERHMDALPGDAAEALTVPPDAEEPWGWYCSRWGLLRDPNEVAKRRSEGWIPLYTRTGRAAQAAEPVADGPADQIIGMIEERFPDWKSYRDLVDCIDCTLHRLRAHPAPASEANAEGVTEARQKAWSDGWSFAYRQFVATGSVPPPPALAARQPAGVK